MRRTFSFWFTVACLILPVRFAGASTPEEDETTLKEAKVATDGASLVEFFRKRILPDNDAARAKDLIGRLSNDRFAIREQATADLISMGPGIVKILKDSVNDTDPEVAVRVKEALDIVERTSTVPLLSAAARMLGHRKHADAARVLLDYAPVADSDEVIDAIRTALTSVAKRDGKAEPALVTALADKQPLRRALAADVLIRSGGLEGDDARKLLKDADALVRLRAALALIDRNDKDAVPALIDVLPGVKLQYAWLAEDVLCRLAGEHTPQVAMATDEASRKKARDEWEKWWKASAATVDLKKLKEAPPFLGFTIVAYQDFNGRGNLMEMDKAGKQRWEFTGLTFPVPDIQVLPNERILIAEPNAQRVSERNKKGEILWQQQINQPVAVQRLANGNVVVGTRQGVFEYNAAGKEVFSHNRQRFDVMSARKHRNGEYILLTQMAIVRINAKGEEIKSWPIARNFSYTSFEILPNGNLLVPLTRGNRVVEYKLDGSEVSAINVNFPTSAQRLPNGNTLVTSMNNRAIIEFDKTGKQVNQMTIQGTPWSAVRR